MPNLHVDEQLGRELEEEKQARTNTKVLVEGEGGRDACEVMTGPARACRARGEEGIGET